MIEWIKKRKYRIASILAVIIAALLAYNIFYKPAAVNLDYHPITEVHTVPNLAPSKKDVVRVLVIEGGGAEGIIPLHVLSYLEKTSGKPVSQLFDMISSTSTGFIIAAGLTRPAAPNSKQPFYSAQQVLNFYNETLPFIFSTSIGYKIITLWGLIGPAYDQRRLAKVMDDHTSKTDTLRDLILPVIVPTYSLDENKPFIFTTYGKNSDYFVSDVLLAATAVPTIFSPVKLYNTTHTRKHTIIDGAIFDNNPALTGLLSAMMLYPNKRYLVVDLGTGNIYSKFHFKDVRSWGVLAWLSVIADMLLQAGQTYTNDELKVLHKLYPNQIEYYHIDYVTAAAYASPFTDDKKKIQELNDIGVLTVIKNKALLDKLSERLAQT